MQHFKQNDRSKQFQDQVSNLYSYFCSLSVVLARDTSDGDVHHEYNETERRMIITPFIVAAAAILLQKVAAERNTVAAGKKDHPLISYGPLDYLTTRVSNVPFNCVSCITVIKEDIMSDKVEFILRIVYCMCKFMCRGHLGPLWILRLRKKQN